jgi:ribosomal protein L10
MPKVVKSETRIKKEKYWARLQHLVATYKNACFVDANNVSSRQICMIRAKLRAVGAVMIMGKNVSSILECHLQRAHRP